MKSIITLSSSLNSNHQPMVQVNKHVTSVTFSGPYDVPCSWIHSSLVASLASETRFTVHVYMVNIHVYTMYEHDIVCH